MRPKIGLGNLRGRSPSAGEDEPTQTADIDQPSATTDSEDVSSGEHGPRPADEPSIRPDLGPPAPGPQSANQPGSGLGLVISVAVSAVVFVLAIYATGSATANPLPLAQTTNTLYWTVALVAVAAAGAGAIYADRTAARARLSTGAGVAASSPAWIVPVVCTGSAIVLVATFHNTTMIVVGPLIAFLGNSGALLSRDLLDDADDSAQRTATTIHAVVIHAVAFIALSAIYMNKLATPATAALAGIAGALLAFEALERTPAPPWRKLSLSLLVGGAIAAAATPLMWWTTHGWTGGAVLFVVFYSALGIAQTMAERGYLRSRDAVEYGLVPLAAFLVLAFTA